MKIGSIVEAVKDQRFNGVVRIKKGLRDEVIEIGEINEINPSLEGGYIKIAGYPNLYCAVNGFRELLPPEAMQEQIKELLEEPVLCTL